MSALTFLVAESFLVFAATVTVVFIGKLCSDKTAEIVTGVVRGIPVSLRMRKETLYSVWLPWNAASVAVGAFLALAQLEMANHVTDANVRLVVYFVAFLGAIAGAIPLVLLPGSLFALGALLRDLQE